MSATRIHLIRHGETPSNAARVVQTPETPLSARGQEQARLLARRFVDAPIGLVLASDLRRAAMTAEAIEHACGVPIELEPLLQERNFGELRGTAYSDLDVDLFGADYEPPAGESWGVFEERVERAWQCIEAAAAGCDGELAVVTHGLVCRSVAARFPTAEPAASGAEAAQQFPNTAVTVFDGPTPWRITRLACTAHLRESDAADAGGSSGAPV